MQRIDFVLYYTAVLSDSMGKEKKFFFLISLKLCG